MAAPPTPTATRDVIVIGASAGGVEALQKLVRELPPDLSAALFVVIHLPPWSRSDLPAIITRNGHIPAVQAESEQPFRPGRIYIAPPDYHLLVERDRVQLWRGPKENRHRPSINALFRSAAVTHKQRVIGIILTGALDDGTTGLWWIKKYGGIAIVQDTRAAAFPDMPRNALDHVPVDYVARLAEMGPLLVNLVAGQTYPQAHASMEEPLLWTRKNS